MGVYKVCKKIEEQRGNLIFYMLFLRLTPLVPNWAVNLCSPIAGIPISYFFVGTFFGHMPMNFIHIQTGLTIGEVSSVGLNGKTLLIFVGISILALTPTLITKKDKEKND